MKNGNESWDGLGDSRKRYRGPWAEIGKYWPSKEPIKLQDSLPCPLKKKIKHSNILQSWQMLEYVKNMIADKETTCEPERNLPTISFCLIPFDIGILMTFQRSSNSYLFPHGTDLSWLYIIRIPPVICGRSSSHIFFQNEQGTYQDARRVHAQLKLWFCFIASITATISLEIPSPGKRRHHIFWFEELSPQISSFDMIFESTSHLFITATYECFYFGSSSFYFLEINGV